MLGCMLPCRKVSGGPAVNSISTHRLTQKFVAKVDQWSSLFGQAGNFRRGLAGVYTVWSKRLQTGYRMLVPLLQSQLQP